MQNDMQPPPPSISSVEGRPLTRAPVQAGDLPRTSLAKRLLSARGGILLARNTVVSCVGFGVGLLLMWVLVQWLGIDEYLAAALSFVTANSIHYTLGRVWIFAGSGRGLGVGYVYFFLNAAIGLGLTMALFALFTELADLHYLVARIVASIFAGLAMFALNAVLNFKSL